MPAPRIPRERGAGRDQGRKEVIACWNVPEYRAELAHLIGNQVEMVFKAHDGERARMSVDHVLEVELIVRGVRVERFAIG